MFVTVSESHHSHRTPTQRHRDSVLTVRSVFDAASQFVSVWFWGTLISTFYCAVYIVLPDVDAQSGPLMSSVVLWVYCVVFPFRHVFVMFSTSLFCFSMVLLMPSLPVSSHRPSSLIRLRLLRSLLASFSRCRCSCRNSRQLALRPVRDVIIPTGSCLSPVT